MAILERPILTVNSMAGFCSAFEHNQSIEQIRFMAEHHGTLTYLLTLPNSEYDHRVRLGFHLLRAIITGPQHLGPMQEGFLRKLFGLGEQILRHLETAVNLRHGGREAIDIGKLQVGYQGYGGTRITSQREQRHLRHDAILSSLHMALGSPVDCLKRLNEACDTMRLCAGTPMRVGGGGLGQWRLPKLTYRSKDKAKQQSWDAEMQFYAIKALQAAAQLLGHRFMRWIVYIRGQIVPGTGIEKGAVLPDWEAIDYDSF
ncbi:hypothetical protein LTR53_008988 [Teratosphaeriaceae sp. CCFEE 6253]|nr:hypothetical protein LTR53_008988 [Teratosphaeriaceae sp. CCFEE 6253]